MVMPGFNWTRPWGHAKVITSFTLTYDLRRVGDLWGDEATQTPVPRGGRDRRKAVELAKQGVEV